MHIALNSLPLLVLALRPSVVSAHYKLTDLFVGRDFLSAFNWETMDDPTHGRVNYVDQQTALNLKLSYAYGNKFVMRADNTSVVQPQDRGRNSIRISSKNSYGPSVMILDLTHMPEGCATWPAFWTLSAAGRWPQGGEVDIIEGVNNQASNLATLHTTPNCTMPASRAQVGSTVSTDCNAYVNNNQGCAVLSPTSDGTPQTASYGSAFNAQSGGYYVVERSPDRGVNVWFWSRHDPTVPASVKNCPPSSSGDVDIEIGVTARDVRNGSSQIETKKDDDDQGTTIWPQGENWGTPQAYFPFREGGQNPDCDWASHFDDHRIVFDLTFCGDWAGSTFSTAGCGSSTCNGYVDNNPSAFTNAYWEVNSLRVYEKSSS